MENYQSPVLLRKRIGRKLKELRREHRLTMETAATRVDRTQGWLSKMENGHPSMQPSSVRLLLMAYGMPLSEVEGWADIARDASERGWWETEEYKEVNLDNFTEYLSAEAAVTRMSYFEVQLVPGIAQTSDYARALMLAHLPQERQGEIDGLTDLRMSRQERLFVDGGPQIRMVLDYPAIRRPIGGPNVMRAQLDHLIQLGKRKHMDLRILPLDAGAEAAVGNAFVYLEFHGDPDFVQHECITNSYYVRDPGDVQRHRITFERLQKAALSQKASTELIQKVMDDLK